MAMNVACGSTGRVRESLYTLVHDGLDLFRSDGYRAGRGTREGRSKGRAP